MHATQIMYLLAFIAALGAAITDARTGKIPNTLTVPLCFVGLLAHLVVGGVNGLIASAVGLCVAGVVPYLFFRLGAMGGGDVKLFAALGSVLGPDMGLEIEVLSLSVGMVVGLALLTWRGELATSLWRSARVTINLVLPKSRRKPVALTELTTLRLGISILAGTALSIAGRTVFAGLLP